MSRHCARRDDNESSIVKALVQVGASVHRIDDKRGVPDLLVGFRRQMYLLEVKAPKGPRGGGGGRLTKKQIEFRNTWRGPALAIVRTDAEALAAIGVKFIDQTTPNPRTR